MKPRRHIAGQTVMLTRRTVARQYFLRPDDRINHIVKYEVARAASRHGQVVHGAMCMSNHPHIVVSDTTGNRSDFMRDAMSGIARARNHDLGRRGYFWDSQPYGDTVLLDVDTATRKLIYTWLNPVSAGLVKRAEDWPGFKILPRDWGKTIEVECPDGFYGRGSPDIVKFTPMPPPGFEDMELDEAIEHFENLLRQAEDELLEQHENRRFKGVQAVLAVEPFDMPTTTEALRTLNPHFATTDAELMEKAKNLYGEFLECYERRRQRWLKGQKQVTFPCGTIQLRRQAPIKCEAPDPAEPGLLAAG